MWTVVTVYLLILIGGIVRSTGAGMGCPDWPKCFGAWVPPTDISQLPANYQEIYGAKLKGEIEFNPVKTWIEYVNRLFGAFTGILIFGTLLASIPYLKRGAPYLFYLSLSAFLLVGFQGWLGSKVVSSELHPVMVTLHMLLAIVIVFILLVALTGVYRGRWLVSEVKVDSGALSWVLISVLLLSVIQITLGTQVREAMDVAMAHLGYERRDDWIDELGVGFYVHRTFSIVVLALNVYLFRLIKGLFGEQHVSYQFARWILIILAVEIATGVLMAYFGVPPFSQPVHLTLGVILIGLQFVLYLNVRGSSLFIRRVAH